MPAGSSWARVRGQRKIVAMSERQAIGDQECADAVGVVERDLRECHRRKIELPGAEVVDLVEFSGRGGGEEMAVGERNVGDGEAGFVVAHQGAGDELEVDDGERQASQIKNPRAGENAER